MSTVCSSVVCLGRYALLFAIAQVTFACSEHRGTDAPVGTVQVQKVEAKEVPGGFSIRFACSKTDSPSDPGPEDLDSSALERAREEYEALRGRLWAEGGEKCTSRGLRLLALADPDRAVHDLSAFLAGRFDRLTQNYDAVQLRNAVLSLGFVIKQTRSAQTKSHAKAMLDIYLEGSWRAGDIGLKWLPTTSAPMLDLAETEMAKGAVLGLLLSEDRSLVERVAGLPDDSSRLPKYFVESYRREAERVLKAMESKR